MVAVRLVAARAGQAAPRPSLDAAIVRVEDLAVPPARRISGARDEMIDVTHGLLSCERHAY
jgi:hypothetical protein